MSEHTVQNTVTAAHFHLSLIFELGSLAGVTLHKKCLRSLGVNIMHHRVSTLSVIALAFVVWLLLNF